MPARAGDSNQSVCREAKTMPFAAAIRVYACYNRAIPRVQSVPFMPDLIEQAARLHLLALRKLTRAMSRVRSAHWPRSA
jgi:hypothetical protein